MSRTIAIGDIHGCSQALRALLKAIEPTAEDTIVTLGDVVDCGPDSKGVLDQLLRLRCVCRLVPILGNHEEMMLAATTSSVELRFWLRSGGREALESYQQATQAARPFDFGEEHGTLGMEAIATEHLDFVRSFVPYFETEAHIFVHANYDADLPLDQQPGHVLRWEFIYDRLPGPHQSGKTVYASHTPQKDGEILDLGYFVCLETDVLGKGWLTALDVDTRRCWQADKGGNIRRRKSRGANRVTKSSPQGAG